MSVTPVRQPFYNAWHLMEHEAHHVGVISHVLGTNGLPRLDI